MKRKLIMAGGGHAQLGVLRALSQHKLDIEPILITPSRYQMYSGMLPGWMAGHYTLDECRLDLLPLAQEAGARVIFASACGVDAAHNYLYLSDGSSAEYDLLSLDIGSETDISKLQAAGELLLPVKPLETFVAQWPLILQAAKDKEDYRLIIVGGGAAGVELAFAAHYAFGWRGLHSNVILVASEQGLLPGHSEGVKRRVRALLERRGIIMHQAQALGGKHGLSLSSGVKLEADCILAATGAKPAEWLAQSDLIRDEQGYILIDAQHRSVSHANVFAAGDVCVRNDVYLPRAGVHAVFAGSVLGNNILAILNGCALKSYRPRKKSLYLLATGPRHAIASWGAFSAQGAWMWCWKNWIDQRFMDKYRRTRK